MRSARWSTWIAIAAVLAGPFAWACNRGDDVGGGTTVALVAAGLASAAFLVAIAGVWGFVVPPTWWEPMVLFAAAASAVLFTIYFSPLAIVPLFIDAIAVWLVLSQGDALTQLATP